MCVQLLRSTVNFNHSVEAKAFGRWNHISEDTCHNVKDRREHAEQGIAWLVQPQKTGNLHTWECKIWVQDRNMMNIHLAFNICNQNTFSLTITVFWVFFSSAIQRADRNSSLRKTFQFTVVGLIPAIWFLQSINSGEFLEKSVIETVTKAKIKLTDNCVQSQNLHCFSTKYVIWTVATATESYSQLGWKQKLVTCLDKMSLCFTAAICSKQMHHPRSANKELFSK